MTWTAPHGRPAGVVLVVHGGAWRAAGPRTVALMDARARTFAGWGWAAAVVDYRAFADAPGDVVRAYDAARERFPGLPICAYGESAGGQLGGLLPARAPPACVRDRRRRPRRPFVAVDGTPQADWVRAKALAAFGDLRDASPTHHAAAIRAPVLAGVRGRRPDRPGEPGALPQARAGRAPASIELGAGRGPALRARHRARRRRCAAWWSAVRDAAER